MDESKLIKNQSRRNFVKIAGMGVAGLAASGFAGSALANGAITTATTGSFYVPDEGVAFQHGDLG